MTTNDGFGRILAAWLDEDAPHHVADHLDEVLQVTAATRQRPAWSSPERWLPVDLTTRRPMLPGQLSILRPLALLLVIALLVAAFVAVTIGSRRSELAPFGPARNGVWVSSADGDLFTIDPITNAATPLLADPGFDFSPIFSRDGTQMVFLRSDGPLTEPAVLTLYVANADGSGLRALTPPTQSLDWFDWSPDGTRIAYMADQRLWVIDVAVGEQRRIEGTGPMHFPTWLPPDGDEIIYRLETGDPAIYAIAPDGMSKRHRLSVTRANNPFDFQSPMVAPDGSIITFTRWSRDGTPSVYAFDLAHGTERAFPNEDGTGHRGLAPFSPDGSLVAYQLLYGDGASQMVVAPSDGSGEARPVGPRIPANEQGDPVDVNVLFTPDGTALIVRYGTDDGGTTHHLPIDGSAASIIGSGSFEFVDVQRLAP